MSDAEFLERAERILANTKTCCGHMLELVDLWGQERAFLAFQAGRTYPRELMVRMLRAGAEGASDVELFRIAANLEKLNIDI